MSTTPAAGRRDPDPQELLPPELRRKWAVVPRDAGYQTFLAGTLVGAGAALAVVGFESGPTWLWLAFPLAVLLARLQRTALPWSRRRLLRELGRRG